LRTFPRLTRKVILAVGVIALLAVIITFAIGPYIVEHGILGRTPFDKPSFTFQTLQLSKNGTTCYISSRVHNSGNVWIERLTLKLNQTHVWDNAWIGPGVDDIDDLPFMNYGDLHCADITPGQNYTATYTSQFADGVYQNATTTVQVGKYPIVWIYSIYSR
jgi:hypothetical protein